MRKTRVIALLMVLVMVSAVSMAAEKGSETLRASCLVKVTSDPSVMQIDETIIEYLIHSSGVAGRARSDVLQMPQDNMGDCFSIFIEPLANQTAPRVRTAATPRATTSRTSTTSRVPTTTALPRTTTSRAPTTSSSMMGGMSAGGMGGGMMGGSSSSPKPTTTAGTRRSSSSTRIGGGMGGYGGGMGGGMMGGMGGYGGGATTRPTRPATSTRSTGTRAVAGADEQTLLFKLEVDLTDCDKPVAEEFLAAVIENLENAFLGAYEMRLEQLDAQLRQMRSHREQFIETIDIAAGKTDEDRVIEEQLKTKVDLSKLGNETPLAEAFDMIYKSVDPPLKLVVLWTDLSNNAFIEKDTPVGLDGDGLYDVMVGAGLARVLDSVAGGVEELDYSVKDGVVTVATYKSLRMLGYSCSIKGATTGLTEVPVEYLYSQRQYLQQEQYSNQLEVSRAQARSRAIEKQLPRLEKSVHVQVSNDAVTMNIESIIEGLERRLAAMKQRVDSGTADMGSLIEIQEKVSRAQIELAKRKEELGEIGGGGRIIEFTSELIELSIEIEAGESLLTAIGQQLSIINTELAMAEVKNHLINQTRQGVHELEQIERRIVELESAITTLARPSVTVIGGN